MRRLVVLALTALIALPGCDSGPTYEDALQRVNAGVELLDNLKEEREKLVRERDQAYSANERRFRMVMEELKEPDPETLRRSFASSEEAMRVLEQDNANTLEIAEKHVRVFEETSSSIRERYTEPIAKLNSEIGSQEKAVRDAKLLRDSLKD